MAKVRRHVGPSRLAEELAQDVFVAAWLGASGYRDDLGGPEGWLLGITHHKLLNHGRRMRRFAEALGMQLGVMTAPMPDLDRLAVEQAFTGLPEEQRRVLDPAYQSGPTFTEAARVLKLSAGIVESRVNHTLTTMRALLMRSSSS
jgi:RNA polymerase sigma-70 factor (ECF subfamily)